MHLAYCQCDWELFMCDAHPAFLCSDSLLLLGHPQALATPVMIQLATPPHPPPPITSQRSRPSPSRSLLLSSHSSPNSPSPPYSHLPSSSQVHPGAIQAATWWQPQLETPTRSPHFTRTNCRSLKGLPNNPSSITVKFARSAVQVHRYEFMVTRLRS